MLIPSAPPYLSHRQQLQKQIALNGTTTTTQRCNHVSIQNNEVWNGGGTAAGIFLHRSSDSAIVKGNHVYDMNVSLQGTSPYTRAWTLCFGVAGNTTHLCVLVLSLLLFVRNTYLISLYLSVLADCADMFLMKIRCRWWVRTVGEQSELGLDLFGGTSPDTTRYPTHLATTVSPAMYPPRQTSTNNRTPV